ncbi:MAG: hypothetical protein ACQEWU_10190 [Bacillota bacterium]
MYMEDSSGEFVSQFTFMLITFFLLAFTIFSIHLTQAIDFKTYVDSQIERNGGFTPKAESNINTYSEEHYQGRYSVASLSGTDKKSFGENIDYLITAQMKILFFDLPDQIINIRGSTISQVR